ncbi:MAG: gliding motility-associated C-terminal domain-containing protein, partial [Bacteroidota bacterium]
QTGIFVVELIATSSTGCTDTVTVDTVSIFETPIADFSSVPWINESTLLSLAQFNFTNQSVFASTYLWSFGDGSVSTQVNPVYTYTTEGNFYVTLYAFNINGCADTVTYGPFTLMADGDIFIPNTFTPNGDHANDVFRIYGTGITSEHMWIYDRWGEKLFESTDLFSSWDGIFQGVDLNVGVYVYLFEVVRYDGTIELKKGDVTLLR